MITPNTLKNKPLDFDFPAEVIEVLQALKKASFESYMVGGCVRDLLMGKTPKDWDICTSANPEEIQAVFPESFYENDFGTVGVKTPIGVIEVTPFRTESGYTDGRRPDTVCFSRNIEDDLGRRDFSINAIAYNPLLKTFVDPFNGQKDIKDRILRAVGNPKDRFSEDGLRIMRLFRFVSQLEFMIDPATLQAAFDCKEILAKVSKERTHDEFVKMLMSKNPAPAFMYMEKVEILPYLSKHLQEAVGVKQNGSHEYVVYEHLVRSMQHAADKNMSLELRLAALLHDIGKPPTRRWSEENNDYTFYGHEVVGAKITKNILNDLKFSHETVEKVVKLVRWHMFFSDTDQITHSAVRRMIANVGKDNIWDLINLRMCDRIGTGRPKEDPYRLRKYMSLIEEVLADPTDVSMLKIGGTELMEKLHMKPGPMIGKVLHILLDICLENPKLNTEDSLLAKTRDILQLSEAEIEQLYEKALHAKHVEHENKIKKIRGSYKVR